MGVQIAGEVGPFLDTVQQRQVSVTVFATCEYMSNQPGDPQQLANHVQTQMLTAMRNVLGQKMANGQISFRHLIEGNLGLVIPEIIAASGLEQQGIRIGNLTASFGIDGHTPPGAPQQQQQQQQQQQNRSGQVDAHIHVGGLNIHASSDGGVDTAGLQNQLKDKAKSQIIWWGIGCAILLVVGLGVVGLGLYIWHSVATDTSGASAARSAAASKWDGKSPFTCGGSEVVSISGVTAKLPGATAITVQGSCKLTLVNVDITGDTAIDAGGNAVVTITGGSINGSTFAIDAGGLAKVNLTGTKVTGKTKANGAAKITGP